MISCVSLGKIIIDQSPLTHISMCLEQGDKHTQLHDVYMRFALLLLSAHSGNHS